MNSCLFHLSFIDNAVIQIKICHFLNFFITSLFLTTNKAPFNYTRNYFSFQKKIGHISLHAVENKTDRSTGQEMGSKDRSGDAHLLEM